MGLPRVVVLHMLANAAVDFVVGAIPVIGDAFDLWFKVNERNLRLVRRHLEDHGASTRSDWLAVTGLIGAMLLLAAAVVWLIVRIVGAIVGLLGAAPGYAFA